MTTNGSRPTLPGRPDNVLGSPTAACSATASSAIRRAQPIMFFHGFPGSRLRASSIGHEAAARAGVRVIAPDRPGMGLSTFQPGRRIVDWPGDVAALADALGLPTFAVAGVSGGGPYAAVVRPAPRRAAHGRGDHQRRRALRHPRRNDRA